MRSRPSIVTGRCHRPQSLAYAMLAGLPPEVGLYASILPLFVYALFGSSMTLAVGPVAAVISLMTAAAANRSPSRDCTEYLGAVILLSLLSGVILVGLGFARAGFLANLLSHSVISGFISASAVLIAFSQLKHILGVPAYGHDLPSILYDLAGHLRRNQPADPHHRGFYRLRFYCGYVGTGILTDEHWRTTQAREYRRKSRTGGGCLYLNDNCQLFCLGPIWCLHRWRYSKRPSGCPHYPSSI